MWWGGEAPKRSEGILRKPRSNLKEEYPGLDTEGISELTGDVQSGSRVRVQRTPRISRRASRSSAYPVS
jgi:hypothetical protein